MLGVTVFQIKAHCAQVSALDFLEQGVLHAGQSGLCAHTDGLLDLGVLGAPAPEGAHRDADLIADLRLRQTVHHQPLESQQAAWAVPLADLRFSGQGFTSVYEKNGTHWSHSGGTLRAEDDPSACRFG